MKIFLTVVCVILFCSTASACYSCSIPPIVIAFRNSEHVKWAWAIALSAAAAPFLPLLLGFRYEPCEEPSWLRRGALALLMLFVWSGCFFLAGDPNFFPYSFGTSFCYVFFLPLYAWTLVCLLLEIPFVSIFLLFGGAFYYCYAVSTLLGRFQLVYRKKEEGGDAQ